MVLPTITHIFRKEHLAQRLLKSARILKLRNYFAVSGFSQPMFYPPFFFFPSASAWTRKGHMGSLAPFLISVVILMNHQKLRWESLYFKFCIQTI